MTTESETATGTNAAITDRSDAPSETAGGVGIADQAKDALGNVQAAIIQRSGPLLDRARKFARERPYATATFVGVLGVALINTLRGRR